MAFKMRSGNGPLKFKEMGSSPVNQRSMRDMIHDPFGYKDEKRKLKKFAEDLADVVTHPKITTKKPKGKNFYTKWLDKFKNITQTPEDKQRNIIKNVMPFGKEMLNILNKRIVDTRPTVKKKILKKQTTKKVEFPDLPDVNLDLDTKITPEDIRKTFQRQKDKEITSKKSRTLTDKTKTKPDTDEVLDDLANPRTKFAK